MVPSGFSDFKARFHENDRRRKISDRKETMSRKLRRFAVICAFHVQSLVMLALYLYLVSMKCTMSSIWSKPKANGKARPCWVARLLAKNFIGQSVVSFSFMLFWLVVFVRQQIKTKPRKEAFGWNKIWSNSVRIYQDGQSSDPRLSFWLSVSKRRRTAGPRSVISNEIAFAESKKNRQKRSIRFTRFDIEPVAAAFLYKFTASKSLTSRSAVKVRVQIGGISKAHRVLRKVANLRTLSFAHETRLGWMLSNWRRFTRK